jgi:hypothetical protein
MSRRAGKIRLGNFVISIRAPMETKN